ncbi:MAG: hypothetical protein ACO1RT_05225 [Planctomycetaceae bacterium]
MRKVTKLRELTDDEVCRVHRTLTARYERRPGSDILEIGLGVAERAGKLDTRRSDAFVFYVPNKRLPRNEAERIPATETVRIKRGRQFVSVELPTDVIEFDRDRLTLTGRLILHATEPDRIATAGAVVLWRIGFSGPFHWSVTTAGHHFWDRPEVPERTPQVTIRCSGDQSLTGRLILRSLPRDGVDIALVEVPRAELIDKRVVAVSAPTTAKRIRSISEIRRDELHRGTTHPESTGIEFRVIRYFYEFKLLPELGTLFDVLKVHSLQNHAFGQGRSGSLWIVARQAACHQSVGWSTMDPEQTYVEGAGQSLHYALRWVQLQLAQRHRSRREQVQIRLVARL